MQGPWVLASMGGDKPGVQWASSSNVPSSNPCHCDWETECYWLVTVGLPLGPVNMNSVKHSPHSAFLLQGPRASHFPGGPVGLTHILVAHGVPAGRRPTLDQHRGTGLAPSQHALWPLSQLLRNWQVCQGEHQQDCCPACPILPVLCPPGIVSGCP